MKMHVEIKVVRDGTAFTYDPKTKTFTWNEQAILRTVETERKEWEENFLKDLKSERQ